MDSVCIDHGNGNPVPQVVAMVLSDNDFARSGSTSSGYGLSALITSVVGEYSFMWSPTFSVNIVCFSYLPMFIDQLLSLLTCYA